MKKLMGFLAALMIMFSTTVYAGGDQVCGDKATGSAGTDGGSEVNGSGPTQTRAAADY
jgi:hypothetical protein